MGSRLLLTKTLRKTFPSPPQSFGPLGNLPYLLEKKNKLGTMAAAIQSTLNEYGDIVLLEMGPQPIIFSKDIELVKFIANNDPEKISKPTMEFMPSDTLGQSILFTEGEAWYKKRKLFRNAFKKFALASYLPKIHQSCIELNDALQQNSNKNLEILTYYKRLTTDNIGRIGFSYEFQCQNFPGKNQVAIDFDKILGYSEEQQTSIFYQTIGMRALKNWTPLGWKYTDALSRVRSALIDVINPRLYSSLNSSTTPTKHIDILQYILESTGHQDTNEDDEFHQLLTSEQKKKLETTTTTTTTPTTSTSTTSSSPSTTTSTTLHRNQYTSEELVHEVILFFVAGYETTSNLLAWATYYIAKNPDIYKKVIEELKQVGLWDVSNDNTIPEWSKINNLPYLTQVLKETLRLHPALPIVPRESIVELKYKNFTIPPKTVLFSHIYSIHRDSQHWSTPVEEFNPERFNTENSKGRDPYAWIPFGSGLRNCIGMQLATLQARVVLAYLLPRFDFTATSEAKIIDKAVLSSENLNIKVKPRKRD